MNWNPQHFDRIKSTWQLVKIPKRTPNKNPKEIVTKPKKKNLQKGKQTKREKKINQQKVKRNANVKKKKGKKENKQNAAQKIDKIKKP